MHEADALGPLRPPCGREWPRQLPGLFQASRPIGSQNHLSCWPTPECVAVKLVASWRSRTGEVHDRSLRSVDLSSIILKVYFRSSPLLIELL